MEQRCGTPTVEFVPGRHCDFSTYLAKRERELILAHAQSCNFLIMVQSCSPMAVEIVPVKHCDFST
jgi:hypothetical protein